MKFKDWNQKEYNLPKDETVTWRPAVYALVIRNDQVLLIKAKQHSLWELPGGAIGLKETMIEALTREVYEETGCKISVKDNQPMYIEDNFFYEPERKKFYRSIPMIFLIKIKDMDLKARLIHHNEVIKTKWFKLSNVPKQTNVMAIRAIQNFISKPV